MSSYVFVMYDIRAKQDFIFKTNHLKEIIGASAIIRDCYKDYLYPAAEAIDRKGIFHESECPFDRKSFEKHIEEGYIGELVYDGGGNLLLLYKDVESYRKVTYLFTKKILEKIGTLRVLSSYIENVNFDNYKGDSRALYTEHSKRENGESNITPWATLPIVQVDSRTSMPLVGKKFTGGMEEKLSKESIAKYTKYEQEIEENRRNEHPEWNEKIIDKIVTEKGEDSLLAIVYIDGNNMGAQVQKCLEEVEDSSYEKCVAALRVFSKEIQHNYIDKGKNAIHELQIENDYKCRLVLGAGDEINFICNAHNAYEYAKEYLENLPENCSSCAGIAVFHSHAPYADVYRIAEECCESAKTLMKEKQIENASFIDFHYCQGAIDVSLEKIRKHEGNLENRAAWYVPSKKCTSSSETVAKIKAADIVSAEEVEQMQSYLNKLGRSNVKGLAELAKKSMAALKLDLKRIEAHMSEEDREDLRKTGIDIDNLTSLQRKLIYDMVIFYDLWFKA